MGQRSRFVLNLAVVVVLGGAVAVQFRAGRPETARVSHVAQVEFEGRPAPTASDANLTDVANAIVELGGAGFAGLVVDERHRKITSYWKGASPKRVLDYADSQPMGVTVRVIPGAPYSRSELSAAADRLIASSDGDRAGVALVALRPEGTGLKVDVLGDVPSAERAARLAAAAGLPADALSYTPNSGIVQKPGDLQP